MPKIVLARSLNVSEISPKKLRKKTNVSEANTQWRLL
jgi:hypothetical protein